MSQMNQSQAVLAAVNSVLAASGTEIRSDEAVCLTDAQKQQVRAILIEGFNNKEIRLGREYDEKGLKNYVSGLINNWLRKSKDLNGGVKYVAKNPGSRTGSTDPQIRSMKALLSTKTDPAERAVIESYITKRIGELKAEKTPKVEIDVAALPEELKGLVE